MADRVSQVLLRRYKPDVDKGRDTVQSIIQSTTDGPSVTTTKETQYE